MTLKPASSWHALAVVAGNVLGASGEDAIRGILAQWTCEQRGTWPPTRNNPGNVAKGFADAVGFPYTIQQPNPQPSNPIVTYSSPELGARAYASGLARFSRYSSALAAARANNGAAFVRYVTKAGYGTSYTCAIGVYRQLGGTNQPPASNSGPGSTGSTGAGSGSSSSGNGAPGGSVPTGTIVSIPGATLAGACASYDVIHPNPLDAFLGMYAIPPDKVGKPCVKCEDGYQLAVIKPNFPLPWEWVMPDQLPPGVPNGCARLGLKPGDTAGLSPDPTQAIAQIGGAIGQVGNAIAGVPAAIGEVLRNVALLVVILVVILVGLWLVAGDKVPVSTAVKAAALI